MGLIKYAYKGPCIDCGKLQPQGNNHHYGMDMWYWIFWTCKHEVTIVCNECYKDETLKHYCSVCSNNSSLT